MAQQQNNNVGSIGNKKQIRKKSEDMSAWYTDAILRANVADYSPVRGCMVLKPYGYALWERIREELDAKIKKLGVQNSYFPMFIPMSLLEREKAHVKGFAPELAVVTHGGGEKLEEPLVVRPTSETIMYEMYSKWIQSYRDLPLRLNQWNNVVRWEKRTQFFLRSMEFLWQEAHTAHATHEEAQKMVLDALQAYGEIAEDLLAMPVVKGVKSESEKFAGAFQTTTIEAMMPDGKALQSGTSHDLGQNFSRAFNISFQNQAGENDYVWQTSFGLSTRIIGGLIMTHGDDQGLVFPPRIAPVQVEIIPVRTDDYRLMEFARVLEARLAKRGVRVEMDDREKLSFGYRINDAEMRGIPLRLEIGPREIDAAEIMLAVRHLGEKRKLSVDHIEDGVEKLLEWIQQDMLEKAKKRVAAMTHDVENFSEFKEIMATKRGFIRAYWDENPETEAKIKELTKATTRCVPLDEEESEGICVFSGEPAKRRWLFAQAY
jgi:prolyl-tRNA synthetase